MNIRMKEDTFAMDAHGNGKLCHEILLLTKFLQTRPEVKNMNFKNYDSYYTVIKKRDGKEIVDNY